jgi:uncharacterized spore protein YtfJ
MDIQALLREMTDRVGASASAKSVYGEPVTAGERTVVPVAKVWYSFGAGGGSGKREGEGSGGGGGGVVCARPAGALEVTPAGARFIPCHDFRALGAAVAAGFFLGAAMVGAARRKRIEIVKPGK